MKNLKKKLYKGGGGGDAVMVHTLFVRPSRFLPFLNSGTIMSLKFFCWTEAGKQEEQITFFLAESETRKPYKRPGYIHIYIFFVFAALFSRVCPEKPSAAGAIRGRTKVGTPIFLLYFFVVL